LYIVNCEILVDLLTAMPDVEVKLHFQNSVYLFNHKLGKQIRGRSNLLLKGCAEQTYLCCLKLSVN